MSRLRLVPHLLGVLIFASLPAVFADQSPPTENTSNDRDKKSAQQAIQFFETKIRPLLANHCYKCHGPKKRQSGLRLDTFAGVLKGGDTGPAIVPGKPNSSLLMTAVSYDDPDLQMPPEKKLTKRQIADLKQWVKLGAPHPDAGGTKQVVRMTVDVEKGREFWAFRPLRDPPTPTVEEVSWPQSKLDLFVLAALEAKGLKPAARADKRTLIRRVTFDVIGLPPTSKEIAAFLADHSPTAFDKVVDRLLASPHYGERWGRHWLDVARYADSNGLDENVAHGNAWRYRDYVVSAFNDDKPFDQFVTEQLAGDLLPTDDETVRFERLIATGFLSLGPKVLAEVDETKMEMDIVDEQIIAVGQAFMGLTLGCARCHAHKFDPIATEDYYSLAGIFKSTRTMETFKKVARWHENSIATKTDLEGKARHDRRVAEKQTTIDRLVKTANEQAEASADSRGENTPPKILASLYPSDVKAKLKRLREQLTELKKSAPEMPTAMGVSEGTIAHSRVHVRGSPLTLGDVAPRGFPLVLLSESSPTIGSGQSGRLQLARWLVSDEHPLTSRVLVNRLWRWHFGQGLVRTPDNFGALGERPTNRPLLDWLAIRFRRNGWSIKAMQRLILLSSTYQMSSAENPLAAKIDPENRLHHRATVRRLEAEAIRDALLAVSDSLDWKMGGSLLQVKNREYFFDHTSKDATRYDDARRSVYLPVVRNHLYDVFQLFDYSDASVLNGDRATSTVAPQALFMLNSDLIAGVSRRLAEGLLKNGERSETALIRRLYRQTLGRSPSEIETKRCQTFLAKTTQYLEREEADGDVRRQRAWRLLCQTLLASNEFIYIR